MCIGTPAPDTTSLASAVHNKYLKYVGRAHLGLRGRPISINRQGMCAAHIDIEHSADADRPGSAFLRRHTGS